VFSYFYQAEDGIQNRNVTGFQTCALPILCWDTRTMKWKRAGISLASFLRSTVCTAAAVNSTEKSRGDSKKKFMTPCASFFACAKIGRASCREREYHPVIHASFHKKRKNTQ